VYTAAALLLHITAVLLPAMYFYWFCVIASLLLVSPYLHLLTRFIALAAPLHLNRYKILAENHFALDAVASALSALVPTSLANASNRVLRSMALDGLDTAIAKAAGLQVRLTSIN
jgi:hypothetical protein